jgi:hypothetical protein
MKSSLLLNSTTTNTVVECLAFLLCTQDFLSILIIQTRCEPYLYCVSVVAAVIESEYVKNSYKL